MNESTDSTNTSGARAKASTLKARLQEDGKHKIESGKRAAADQIAEIADAIDVAGAQLDQSQPTLANYASRLAEGVSGLATRLREDSLEDLYRDIRQAATRHPGMFLLGSAALGVVIARFMKASGDQQRTEAELGGTVDSEARDWGETTADVAGMADPGVADVRVESASLHRQSVSTDTFDPDRRGV